jgi:hypothetical protein
MEGVEPSISTAEAPLRHVLSLLLLLLALRLLLPLLLLLVALRLLLSLLLLLVARLLSISPLAPCAELLPPGFEGGVVY